jgi:hypothetical protein
MVFIANDHILCDIKYNISTFISIYATGATGKKEEGKTECEFWICWNY